MPLNSTHSYLMILAPHLLDPSPWLRSIDRLFTQAFGQQSLPAGVRLRQDENGWSLEADLPGTSREALGLEVTDGELRLKVDGKPGLALRLGPAVDAAGIHARYELGVLEVRLPKAATAETRQISIL